jgi:cob(I)alamin adenosyltransferase
MTENHDETAGMTEAELARHSEKMAKKKQAREKIMATKTDEKGLVIVHTGKGKGKSTAAFGMVFRALGHGIPVAMVQFVKGKWQTGERVAQFIKGAMLTGERELIETHFSDICQFYTLGEGFTWETQDRARDVAMAEKAWEKAKELIRDERNSMVLLDEINIALRYDYLDVNEVIAFLKTEKPHMTHVVLTGRNAKEELIEIADLATEMELLKHPFRSGIKAQQGVEY